jgi:hypothetical protein
MEAHKYRMFQNYHYNSEGWTFNLKRSIRLCDAGLDSASFHAVMSQFYYSLPPPLLLPDSRDQNGQLYVYRAWSLRILVRRNISGTRMQINFRTKRHKDPQSRLSIHLWHKNFCEARRLYFMRRKLYGHLRVLKWWTDQREFHGKSTQINVTCVLVQEYGEC